MPGAFNDVPGIVLRALREPKPFEAHQVLRRRAGQRDAAPGISADFLGIERLILSNHGWNYSNGYWFPPK